MKRVVILIPARFGASRFPGKPLAIVSGRSMVMRVYDQAISAHESLQKTHVVEAYVVTDDDRIEKHVLEHGGKIIRVDDDVPSGTERIALAFKRNFKSHEVELVINLQGDEPLLGSMVISQMIDQHLARGWDVGTIVRKRTIDEEFFNPNVVKVVIAPDNGRCLYFSRAPIPFDRDRVKPEHWYQHAGIYSYTPEALEAFCKARMSHLEKIEKLEQLRGMELGMHYGAVITETPFHAIDVPEDVKIVEKLLSTHSY
ncbi:MAG: 3-deoxy-manno-octulosonate cytidylyltransferase [Bdellovibrio sp.]